MDEDSNVKTAGTAPSSVGVTTYSGGTGTPAAQEVQAPLKEVRRGQIEAGLRAFQETAQEAETLRETIRRLEQDLAARNLEIKSLNERMDQQRDAYVGQISMLESRAHEHEAARDQAVAEKVALQTILVSMRSVFRLAPLPEEP